MSKNKSLGSSPIGHDSSEPESDESFRFIPDLGVVQKSGSVRELSHIDGPANYKSPAGRERSGMIRNVERFQPIKKHSENESSNNDLSGTKQEPDKNSPGKEQKSEKQIVSYNLEKTVISRLKRIADERGVYYSTLVSEALKFWLKLQQR